MNLIPGQGHFGPDAIPGVRTHMLQTLSSCARAHARYTRSPLRLSGCALASRRVGLAQDGQGHNGPAGACPARPNGLHGPLNDLLGRKKMSDHNDTGNKAPMPMWRSLHACFTVWVGGTAYGFKTRVFYTRFRLCGLGYKEFRLRMSRLCSVRHMPVRGPLAAIAVPWLEVPVVAAAASVARTARAVRPLLPPPVSPAP